ncbi:lysophospholipid acyltransferase family protein [Calycomorphotria hydatis]|uniref:1-acyl-sn-glycerol-3-phosphate acyltransferase n=1 Tax=Calycomorphotria hydatis TaxID=2528027 RepID=A0A517T3K5_9PLAN|nr:lysophospholipid acyltransferase family protein [Calycomorphotria hydatis]QDT62960.1 1-acyl-sn-glycerol-3-phosphate acyltransferase [Calycomorphotria hydatis]
MALRSRRNAPWLITQWILRLVFSTWLKYRGRGMEHLQEEGGLILANHQSFLDPLLIGLPLARPISYLARDSLFKIPILGPFIKATYVLPINRDAAGGQSIREMRARMDNGFLVGMFPEGTRTSNGDVSEFKPGFLALLNRMQHPVYPVGIAGAYEALPRGAFFLRPGRVRVVFGEPIQPEELQAAKNNGRDAVMQLVHERVVACVDEAKDWRAKRD